MIEANFIKSAVQWHEMRIDQPLRSSMKQHPARCIWLTGLSGAGKSTLANLLEQHLYAQGLHTYLLDGDNVRHGLCADLGFTHADRSENVRRVAHVARLMVDAGLLVVVSLISPFRQERQDARSLFAQGEFVEVFVDTDLSLCEQRDAKGLYAKARRGELPMFTGIDSPYEAPQDPEIHLRCSQLQPAEALAQLVRALPMS
jgi:bifunctional enzyme CysN/CysC